MKKVKTKTSTLVKAAVALAQNGINLIIQDNKIIVQSKKVKAKTKKAKI